MIRHLGIEPNHFNLLNPFLYRGIVYYRCGNIWGKMSFKCPEDVTKRYFILPLISSIMVKVNINRWIFYMNMVSFPSNMFERYIQFVGIDSIKTFH